MTTVPAIRDSLRSDLSAIHDLYPAAFPDEDLLPLIRLLLDGRDDVMSLVAERDGALVGHVAFSHCTVTGSGARVALLGPLAVAPEAQRGGIGSALVRAGHERLAGQGVSRVLVLGDPAYYGRFGFRADDRIRPPYPMPPEWSSAWQSLDLTAPDASLAGTLVVPAPWQDPALWS